MKRYLITVALCLFAITSTLFSQNSSWFVDLNSFPLYVKSGFEISDTTSFNKFDLDKWVEIAPADGSGRLARPVDLNIPGIPRHDFLSFKTYKEMEFTYTIPFTLNLPNSPEVPGIHFAALGDNWEIYLNGELVRDSIDLNERKEIEVHHSRRDVYFPLNASLFKDGENLLVLRIICDPSYESNGFHQASPYYIDTYENISKDNSSLLTFALLILYLFMGIYHIFLYFSGKNFRYNLFYGLFSADLFLYLFMRTHIVYNLIPDTQLVFKIELLSLFAILPIVSSFMQLIVGNNINKITKGYSIFSAILGLFVIFTPANINLDILRIWQITGLLMILYIFFCLIFWKFIVTTRSQWKRQNGNGMAKSKVRVVLQTLSKTAIGNLFIGGVILVGTGIFDILDSMIFQLDLVLTNYGFLVFTLGSAFVLANRFAFMNKQMDDLNQSLEKKILEVEKASEKSRISEKKYRSLFEGNSDAVLLLGEGFTIVDGNNAGMKLLGTNKENMQQCNIFQSLASEGQDKDHSQDLFRLKLNEILVKGKTSDIKLRFSGKMGETQAVRVRLELIKSLSGAKQILFRGILIQEDSLLDYFVGEKLHYKISNSFPLTEDVSRRITSNLAKYMDKGEAEILYIGLREIILNAVEHGNLNIDFDEKTKAQEAGQYMELLINRQSEPEYKDKKIMIEASINNDKVIYRVSDEGPGFDHKTFMRKTMNQVNETLAHGRGISMAFQLFDRIQYNEKGNQVTLVKNFSS